MDFPREPVPPTAARGVPSWLSLLWSLLGSDVNVGFYKKGPSSLDAVCRTSVVGWASRAFHTVNLVGIRICSLQEDLICEKVFCHQHKNSTHHPARSTTKHVLTAVARSGYLPR